MTESLIFSTLWNGDYGTYIIPRDVEFPQIEVQTSKYGYIVFIYARPEDIKDYEDGYGSCHAVWVRTADVDELYQEFGPDFEL